MLYFLRGLWQTPGIHTIVLIPFEWLYRILVGCRKFAYELNPPKPHIRPPIIVVGGITVGGAGKTPAVISLTEELMQRGLKVGIISRGYKGSFSQQDGMNVRRHSNAKESGDEPLLLASRLDCPIYVHPKRNAAAQHLAKEHNLDVIISDDGLQHYALHRSLEVAVVDAVNGLGNRHCLPAGPLREPISRLRYVDYVLLNCLNSEDTKGNDKLLRLLPAEKIFHMTLKKIRMRRLGTEKFITLQQWKKRYTGKKIWAIAGIAQPENFFRLLRGAGIDFQAQAFPNHHLFSIGDFERARNCPIIITEKDAVKCERFDIPHLWVLCREAKIDNHLITAILRRLSRL